MLYSQSSLTTLFAASINACPSSTDRNTDRIQIITRNIHADVKAAGHDIDLFVRFKALCFDRFTAREGQYCKKND
jgi:hypothetical protein